ncbi:MAG: hypothetical protein HYX27_05030 [Acidobacteria bacterium]|nr:hypothetical protein [Acidobacteriota bacterium]
MPYVVAIILFLFLCPLFGQNKQGKKEPFPVPVWSGSGETGPSSTSNDVFITADGHELIVLAPDENQKRSVKRVRLWNQIEPTVDIRISSTSPGRIQYRYAIGNLFSAKDPIGTWTIVTPPHLAAVERVISPEQPKRWGGAVATAVIARQELLNSPELGRYLRWYHHQDGGQVQPGEVVAGFGIESPLVPGFTTAWFAAGKQVEFNPSWPDRIFKQLELLEDKKWRGRGLLVLGPMHLSGTSPSVIRTNYRAGLNQMIKAGQLDEKSAFIAQLLRALAEPDGDTNPSSRTLSARPRGNLETAISSAVKLSLGIESR